ncbi:MAG TPA: hypothetical protein V6C91_06315 [Coleofasciculaceae cyanobacterium]
MNTPSYSFWDDNHFHENREKVLDETEKCAIYEELELLREQAESLKQALRHECQITNDYIEELAHTNKEVELMNKEICELIASNTLPIDEVKKLAESIVAKNKSVSESIGELLSAIYRSPVELQKFEQVAPSRSTIKIHELKAEAEKIRAKSAQVKVRASQLAIDCYKITSRSCELMVRSDEIQLRSHAVRNQVGTDNAYSKVS